MTVAALWMEGSHLFAVADTRLSRDEGVTRLTDAGPKLLPVPVTAHTPSSSTGSAQASRRTLGAIVVGDIAPALLTVTSASMLLASLVSPDGGPPTLEKVSEFVAKLASRVSRDYLGTTKGTYGRFQILLLGACPRDGELGAYNVHAREQPSGYEMVHSACDLTGVSAFGSGRDRFEAELKSLEVDGDAYGRTSRLPIIAVENMITDAKARDVGGTPSIGWASRGLDFTLAWRTQPVVPGAPAARRVLNGFDLDDLGGVGACVIGGNGLA